MLTANSVVARDEGEASQRAGVLRPSGHPPVAIVGATASGKSSLALEAARRVPGVEIVVVDSMQVYRGMDIGTAKPNPAEQAEVPHHCIDLVDPDEEFAVTAFQEAYRAALTGVAERGGRPLLVAGTGLYLRAAVDGLRPPGRWPAVAAEIESEPDTIALHARLARIDPRAAAAMEPTNRRRIVRALEVCVGSGRPFSSFGPGLQSYPRTDVVQIGLRWPRPVLARRAADRFQSMLDAGFVAEVARLAARPGGLSRSASQALGYKELFSHLAGRCGLDEASELAVRRTQRFGVRQLRWFQRDPRIRWIDMEADRASALDVLVQALT